VFERWEESNSVVNRTPGAPRRLLKEGGLRALIGQTATDALHLDLRSQGPHALVGGTTGAGKSELLQSWILSLAATYSPDRLTFLLVDYKGGSAFGECKDLPHTVGMVTDLNGHLARRALVSLAAELRHRERILNRKRAKDLVELERRGDPEAPPSLVIVIDEFAALVQELPEFVDGMVNVAQRGRSLGLHLILATQRPAGVIKDNLRANTNLRIALRMADEVDSEDVVGSAVAASFDPALPGRASAKLGPGRLVTFQAAYAGGTTSDEPPTPTILIEDLVFGTPRVWEEPVSDATQEERNEVRDIARIVRVIRTASDDGGIPSPRQPWLPELAPIYELRKLPTPRRDTEIVFGVLDDPDHQSQPMAAFYPDRDGNLAIYGTGGAGKSTALRSLAVSAGFNARGGNCHIYGIDFGSKGLDLLRELPHVGSIIDGDDHELVARLLKTVRTEIDGRAARFAEFKVGSLSEYRERAQKPDEPRILLIVDAVGAFRQAYEGTDKSKLLDMFVSIAQDGRPVGVHVIVTADRPAALTSSLASAMQRRIVLRLSNEGDMAVLGVPADALGATSPPGRGYYGDHELQFAVFGGSANIAEQAASIGRLAEAMRKNGVADAPVIERLKDHVFLGDLPADVGSPVIGLSGETLGPLGMDPSGTFLVSGPPSSGRTTAIATLAVALRRWSPEASLYYYGHRNSTLNGLLDWNAVALGADDVATAATELVAAIDGGAFDGAVVAVVLDTVAEFLNTPADQPLQALAKALLDRRFLLVADGDPGALAGSWPLLQAVRASRRGVALQPDQSEGLAVFKTPFPRVNRVDFPPGRGLYVSNGRVETIQIALSE
jgi:S-DNA-T family DNA segregation ATPase FtsK/SpoIIIE